jgi:hypothetical protein
MTSLYDPSLAANDYNYMYTPMSINPGGNAGVPPFFRDFGQFSFFGNKKNKMKRMSARKSSARKSARKSKRKGSRKKQSFCRKQVSKKIRINMSEMKKGLLRTSTGYLVTDPRQAIAISYSQVKAKYPKCMAELSKKKTKKSSRSKKRLSKK